MPPLVGVLSQCPTYVWPLASFAVAASAALFARRKVVLFYGHHALFFGALLLALPVLVPCFLFRPGSVDNATRASHLVLRHLSRLLGVSWELRGAAVLGVQRGAVVVSNHQSTMLDTLGMFNILRTLGKCAPVSRSWRLCAGPLGPAARLAGVVFIDLGRPERARRQLQEAARRLMCEEQTKLWLFPEGALNRAAKTLLPFKKGAFRAAIDCQVPVLPVVFAPYHFVDYDKHEFGRGTVVVQALEPIPTEGLTLADVDWLAARTRALMLDALVALTDEVAADRSLPPVAGVE